MSQQPEKPSRRGANLSLIVEGELTPVFKPEEPATPVTPVPREQKPRRRAPLPKVRFDGNIKERAHQLSVYLEPPVYDELREIAHHHRTKMHRLMLEALDMFFKKHGSPSIAEQIKRYEAAQEEAKS